MSTETNEPERGQLIDLTKAVTALAGLGVGLYLSRGTDLKLSEKIMGSARFAIVWYGFGEFVETLPLPNVLINLPEAP